MAVLIAQAIVAMDMDLSETFKLFDTDGDGTVDLKEAKQAKPLVIHGDWGVLH